MIDAQKVTELLDQYDYDSRAPERSLAAILERGLKDRITYVLEKSARAFLVQGSLLLRAKGDHAGAKRAFDQGASMGLRLAHFPLGEAPRRQWDYYFSLCDALLACQFDAANTIATSIFSKELPSASDYLEWRYGFAMLLASVVLRDLKTFELVRKEVNLADEKEKVKGVSWWVRHGSYIELWHAILLNDAEEFSSQLRACHQGFAARAKDKSLDDVALEDGGCENNEYVVDYMALAALILARHQGLAVDFDSPYVPMGYIRFVEQG